MKDTIKLCIVGWYGTETLGDRSILDGIICIFNQMYKNVAVSLGSLYPFYTERTLLEEKELLDSDIKVFDSKNNALLKKRVQDSDYVVLGGGPIMDIRELYIVERAFKYGKKYGKRNIIMGCGLGPLNSDEYISLAGEIINISDLIIYRDKLSWEYSTEIFGKSEYAFYLEDPAIVSICKYWESQDIEKRDAIAINLRKFPGACKQKDWPKEYTMAEFLNELQKSYEKIYLVPMHSFFIGGDDREYLYQILKLCSQKERIQILNRGLNLSELYHIYASSQACIGMRYHSVVMQTILNGNNYIFNYTDNDRGKISGFLSQIEAKEFYHNRVYDGERNETFQTQKIIEILKRNEKYEYHNTSKKIIEKYKEIMM